MNFEWKGMKLPDALGQGLVGDPHLAEKKYIMDLIKKELGDMDNHLPLKKLVH